MVTPTTNHVIARAGFTLCGVLGLWGFSQDLPAKCTVDENRKKVLPFERGTPGAVPW